jgi:hypothetical protein
MHLKQESLLRAITEFEFFCLYRNSEHLFIKNSISHDHYPSDRKLPPASENITTLVNRENKNNYLTFRLIEI